jgi:glycogen debranching enzyme
MDVLALIAEKLNQPEQQIYWTEKADKLTELFCEYFLVDDLPVAKQMLNDEIILSNGVLPLVSLVLGNRLPSHVRKNMIDVLTSERYLTKWGIATEAIDSSYYDADAYWRGPIWAPTTLLFVEALKDCGEHTLASEIADRFCEMARLNGFPENFDATSGNALRDKSFTWTASTFIHFVSQIKYS